MTGFWKISLNVTCEMQYFAVSPLKHLCHLLKYFTKFVVIHDQGMILIVIKLIDSLECFILIISVVKCDIKADFFSKIHSQALGQLVQVIALLHTSTHRYMHTVLYTSARCVLIFCVEFQQTHIAFFKNKI